MSPRSGSSRLTLGAILAILGLALLSRPAQAFQACRFDLPTQSVCFTLNGPFPPPPAAPTYIEIVLAGIGPGFDVVDGVGYPGWCDDDQVSATPGQQYCDIPTILRNSTGTLPVYLQAIPWDKINYLLNHKGSATPPEIQDAIWQFTNGTACPSNGCNALVDDANANGNGFVPGSGDIVAIILDNGPNPTVQPSFFELTCNGCPPCVNPDLGLGAAGDCTVLELGTGHVDITGPAGGLIGDVCIAPGGKLSITGSEYVTGAIRLGAGATYSKSGSGTTGPVLTNQNLSAEINAAQAAASAAATLSCTQTFTSLNNNLTIVGNGGLNVICVTDIILNGKTVTLFGGPSDLFVFKVTGRFVLNGGGKILASGVPASNVLYDVIGTGQDVAFTGGGGGISCCNSKVDGTLLATQRKISLSPGLVNGEVISGRDISIVSGSSVRCPVCQ
jgi:hypothetical protein